jgi:hypothetical protein
MNERMELLGIFRKYVHPENFNHYIEHKLSGDFIFKLVPLLNGRGYNDVESLPIFKRVLLELSYCAEQLKSKEGGSVKRAIRDGKAAINRIERIGKGESCGYRIERRYSQESGHIWLEVLSDCGEDFEFEDDRYRYFDFCPYCGRPMKKEHNQ